MSTSDDYTIEAEFDDDHALAMASLLQLLEEPASRRFASMVADPMMGSFLASLPRKDSAIV
jgi:hypothetical protein